MKKIILTGILFGNIKIKWNRPNNNGFSIIEASKDEAYPSRDNVSYVDSIDGNIFILFRTNSVCKSMGKSWVW